MAPSIAEDVLEVLERRMEQNNNLTLREDQILDELNDKRVRRVNEKHLSRTIRWLVDHDFVHVISLPLFLGAGVLVYRLNDDRVEVQRRRMERANLVGQMMAHAFEQALREIAEHEAPI